MRQRERGTFGYFGKTIFVFSTFASVIAMRSLIRNGSFHQFIAGDMQNEASDRFTARGGDVVTLATGLATALAVSKIWNLYASGQDRIEAHEALCVAFLLFCLESYIDKQHNVRDESLWVEQVNDAKTCQDTECLEK